MRQTSCLFAVALFLGGAGSALAQDTGTQFSGTFGYGYSNGNYGTNRNTDISLALSTLSAKFDNLQFSVSMPYLRISGRGLVVFDAAGNPIVINRRTSIAPDVRTGFGDLNLSATYEIPPAILDDFQVKLTGFAKLPTASERRRLSTGEADFGMSMDISHAFGIWTPFLTLGYLLPGQPATYALNNTFSVSTGTGIELDDNLVAIFSYDYDSPSAQFVESSQELFGSISWIVNPKITLTSYGTTGLSSGSPSIGGGLLLAYQFN